MPSKIEVSAETVKDKLKEAQGNISFAANRLGVHRSWLHTYINEHPTVKAALDDIREGTLDRAETMLQTRMAQSDTLLIFFLKTQGHKRGYTERHVIANADGEPFAVKVIEGPKDVR